MTELGHDFLGAGSKHWNTKAIQTALRGQKRAIGAFDKPWKDSFGDPTKFFEALEGIATLYRPQIWWDYGHKLVPEDVLAKRLPHWEAFARSTNIPVYLSPSCEYTEKDQKKIQRVFDLVQRLAPSCIPVANPLNSWAPPGILRETHLQDTSGNQGFSDDGIPTFDKDAQHLVIANTGAYRFVWGYRYNMTYKGSTAVPARRTVAPDKYYILGCDRLLFEEGSHPKPIFRVTELKPPFTYKTFAEDQKNPNGTFDPRSNKPCLIIPEKVSKVEVVTWDNKVVATLGYYDDYPPAKGHRYYSGYAGGSKHWAYQIANRAKAVSGSEFVWFKVGNKFYGTTNAAFRTKPFRTKP